MRESRSCDYDPDLFSKVKESVTIQQAVEYCGIQVNRKGLATCPFHQDKNPSLKIYPNGKGFYCFACGTGGDQIKFVSKFHDVNNYEAAKMLAAAYGVPIQIPVSYRDKREAELKRRKRQEIELFTRQARMYLMVYYGLLCEAIREKNEHFYEGLDNISWSLYMLENIETCPEQVYEDKKAVRRIGEIEGRIADWYVKPQAVGTISG